MSRGVVLLVEDDPLVRQRVKLWLESARLDVRCASEYATALEEIETCEPALACVDLTLPRESGLDLVEAIRAHDGCSMLPIIMMSDRHSPEDMAEAERVGADAFLKKPFERELLLKYIEWILDRARPSRPSVRALRRVEG